VDETGVARPVGQLRTVIRSRARSKRHHHIKEKKPAERMLYDLRPKAEVVSDSQKEASSAMIRSPLQEANQMSRTPVLSCNSGDDVLHPFEATQIREDVGNTSFLLHHCK
jgi:hypothetical protein